MGENKSRFIFENKHLIVISLINFIIIYISTFTPGYGYFIDEFYYIACANNPAMGYVDHPPLAPLILMIFKAVFGDSLFAVRFIPAVAASFTVFMTGILTKNLGGNKVAQGIASFAILSVPVIAVMGSFYSMNSFEPLFCAMAFYYLIKMFNEDKPGYWIHLGIVFGVLIMNKHTAFLFIFFTVILMLFTQQRKYIFTKYFFYCILISFAITLPNIIWQIQNGFPSLEFYITNVTSKNIPMQVTEYLLFNLFAYNPFVFPVWFAGLLFLLFNKSVGKFRLIGLIFLISFMFFLISRSGRVDRMAYAYIGIIPAGAIFIENFISRIKQRRIYTLGGAIMFGFFALIIPLLMPYLNYEKSAVLTDFFGMNTEVERGNKPLIPQLLADRIGWQEKADMVGKVYQGFSEEDRKKIIIAADNYGSAGALELLGKKYGIKNVVSGHNNYYYWSKGRLEGDIVLQLTHKNSYNGLKESFEEVDSTNMLFNNEYCTPHERNLSVFIYRKPKYPKEELLERARNFY